MGPFHLPWNTFLAFLVIVGSVILAIVWALWDKRRENRERK
jgi:heme/copper-type cytochrome/quinol oxidase subunit 2